MSADTDASTTEGSAERTITELRAMDKETAMSELSVAEFKRWESVNEKLDEHEAAKARWDETRAEATSDLVSADPASYAVDVEVWGNDLAVYYGADDPRLRETAERLADVFDIDAEAAAEGEVEDITAEDVAEEDIDAAKDVLADLVTLAVVEWDGTAWGDLAGDQREAIHAAITADPPDGWGLSGLMDAWTDIQYAVEANRDERMERVRKFRQPGRRGDR